MLTFDIDLDELRSQVDGLEISEKVFKSMIGRACNRTAATLRKLSGKGLKNELQLRTLGTMRNRLRTIKLRGSRTGVALWYGLNDLPVSVFKGRVKQDQGGAWSGDFYHAGGFVGKTKKGKGTIFKRKGTDRLPIVEQLNTIKDQADIYVEDEIFTQTEEIFWGHFMRDLKAREKYKKINERWQ